MLHKYSPLIETYNKLWEKYGPKPIVYADCFLHDHGKKPDMMKIYLLATQEDSVRWSLRLKDVLEAIAKEKGQTYKKTLHQFSEAVKASKAENKLIDGFTALGDADSIVERFQLFFRLSSMDDLFLSDESEISSVYLNE